MSDIRFPMSLKPIVNRGYSQTRGSNIWRNDVQGGVPRQGRDTYFEPVPISITLVVSSLGRQAFYSFLNNIHGGADSFIMPNDTGLGVQDHLVWITSQISDNTDGGKNWIISFTATAERTAIQEDTCLTANLPDLYGCYGDCLGSFFRAFGDYMTTFPRIWESEPIFDMRAAALDPRITYTRTGPYYYLDQSKSYLSLAPDGVWPLEYFGAGNNYRTMPEPESTNLLPYSAALTPVWAGGSASLSRTGTPIIDGVPSTIVTATATTSPPRIAISNSADYPSVTDGDYTISFLVRQGTAPCVHASIERGVGAEPGGTARFFMEFSTGTVQSAVGGSAIVLRSVQRSSSVSGWFLLTARVTIKGLSRVSVYVGPSESLGATTAQIGQTLMVGLAQLERSDTATSPIVTQATPVTRPEVVVTVPKNLHTGLIVHTTQGDISTQATENSRIKVPTTTQYWRTWPINTMEYIG